LIDEPTTAAARQLEAAIDADCDKVMDVRLRVETRGVAGSGAGLARMINGR
jgi:uncharacterized protein YqkB